MSWAILSFLGCRTQVRAAYEPKITSFTDTNESVFPATLLSNSMRELTIWCRGGSSAQKVICSYLEGKPRETFVLFSLRQFDKKQLKKGASVVNCSVSCGSGLYHLKDNLSVPLCEQKTLALFSYSASWI